jgi:Bacterial Ig-like domain (group 3)
LFSANCAPELRLRRIPSQLTLLFLAVCATAASAGAQGALPLSAVVTDQTPLDLSDRFGIPAASGVDQLGNFAFIGRSNSALFLRRAGSATIERLLQAGDEVPGLAGSRVLSFPAAVDIFGAPEMPTRIAIASGRVCFLVAYALSDGLPHQAILVYDGASYRTVVSSEDIAPDSGGTAYGGISSFMINDNGDVAFTATLRPMPATYSFIFSTLYLAPAGATVLRIVGPEDTLPSTLPAPPGSLANIIQLVAINDSAQALFVTGLSDAYVGAASGIQIVGSRPVIGLPSFNDAGTVAFLGQVLPGLQSGLAISTVGGSQNLVVVSGSAGPGLIGGTISPVAIEPSRFGQQAPLIDTAGDILFGANVTGSAVTTFAVLRRRADSTLDVVAYEGQPAPGAAGKTFASFLGPSISSDGRATFTALFTDGGAGIYEQTGASDPVLVALEGEAAPLGGGVLQLFDSALTGAMDDGSTYFRSVISGGTATFAELLKSPGGLSSLMSTESFLPAGGSVNVLVATPTLRRPYVSFVAQRNGGMAGLFVRHLSSGVTAKLATEGDLAPGSAERILFASDRFGDGPALNSGGQVAFISTTTAGGSGLFLASPAGGLVTLAASGDNSPVAGTTFSSIQSRLVFAPLQMSDSGRVAFIATLSNSLSGVFLYTPGGGITKIALQGEAAPGGSVFAPFNGQPLTNSLGDVQFQNSMGMFSWSGGVARKIALVGDALPDGSTVGPGVPMSFGDDGRLLFGGVSAITTPTVSRRSGVFLGAPNGPLEIVARDGDPTPAGGLFALSNSIALRNRAGDIATRSGITGGTADSGIFRRMASGPSAGILQTVAVEGQSLPGGIGTLDSVPLGSQSNAWFALGPAGDVAFVNPFLPAGGSKREGAFLSRPNGAIGTIVAPGDAITGIGGAVSFVGGIVSADQDGGIALTARAEGGSAEQLILFGDLASFTLKPTTASLGSSLDPAVGGQSVTLTATVTSAAGGSPTGAVRFLDNGVQIGSGMLDGAGGVELTSASLAVGSHTLTADYAGDFIFAAATSAVVTETIRAAGFAAIPGPMSVTAGQSVSIPLTLFAAPGSGLNFTLSVSGLPANSSATFSANPVAPAAPPAGTTIQLMLVTQAASGAAVPRGGRPWWWPLGLVALGLAALLPQVLRPVASRRRLATATGLATFLLASLLVGCSSSGSGGSPFSNSPGAGTPKGAATLTVTAVSGSTTVTTDVPIVVQ